MRSDLAIKGAVPPCAKIVERRQLGALVPERGAGQLQQACRVSGGLARPFDLVAEQGHRAVGEPAQQSRAFLVGERVGVGAHRGLEHFPVGDRGADIGEDVVEIGDQIAPAARVDAVDLDIHDRFALALIVADRLDRGQLMIFVARDAHDGMEQAMNGEIARDDRVGDGIDQKGHVVVDDADPHAAVTDCAADRFKLDQRGAGGARLDAGGDEVGRFGDIARGEIGDLAWQCAVHERTAQRILHRQVSGLSRYHAFGIHNVRLLGGRHSGAVGLRKAICNPGDGRARPWGPQSGFYPCARRPEGDEP